MRNILILTLIVMTSVSVHQQYAMEQEKTLSHNIKSLRNHALSVYLKHADFNNISIQELPNLEFLDQLPQSPKIAEYLTKKYLKPVIKDTFPLKVDGESFSYDGKTLLVKQRKQTIKQYILNLQNNRFDHQKNIKCGVIYGSKITQFEPSEYVLWNRDLILDNNGATINIPLKESKNIVVGIAKNNNDIQIFMATKDGKNLIILPEKVNLNLNEESWIIDGIGFRSPIKPDTIVIAKDGSSAIVEDAAEKKKFMWDRTRGIYVSLANFIDNKSQILDLQGNKYILVRELNIYNFTYTLKVWRRTRKKQCIVFSRKYSCYDNLIKPEARLIEKENKLLGILTQILGVGSSKIIASLFNTEPCTLNPTELLLHASSLKHSTVIETSQPTVPTYDSLD